MNLWWELTGTNKRGDWQSFALHAGQCEADLATLERCSKLWQAWIWLPTCDAPKRYGELGAQRESCENVVRKWFELCAEERSIKVAK